MRRLMSMLLAASLVFGFCQFGASARDITEEIIWSSNEEKRLYLGNSIVYLANLKISEPKEVINEKREKEYHKKVKVEGNYFITGTNEQVLSSDLEMDFRYDGKNSSIINKDIKKETKRENKKWKLSSSEEIFKSDSQSIVSEKMLISKKKKNSVRRKYKEIDNFHIDTICSANGEINFNLKSLTKVPDIKYDVKKVFDNSVRLDNGVIRQVVEKDKVFKVNELEGKGNYKYVTRRMEVSYLSKEGSTIASVFVEANFRYNPDTKDVQCISTTKSAHCLEGDGKLKVYARTGNETKSYGGAYGIIKVKHVSGAMYDVYEDKILIKCDYNGNITSHIIY